MDNQYGEFINIDSLHYATIQDSKDAYIPGINKYLAPAGEISHDPSVNTKTRYYDGVAMFTTSTEGETKVGITISGVPMSVAAEVTGKYYDKTSGVLIDTGEANEAPWCALSGRMELGDGGYQHFQYLKGKFSVGKTSAKSKNDDIDPQTTELNYIAVRTLHEWMVEEKSKGVKGLRANTTDPAFNETYWFNQVQTPDTIKMSIDKLALSENNPSDNSTGITANIKPTITFNNAIVDYSNVLLLNQTDGVSVEISKTLDATNKVITISPTSNLVSGKNYSIIIAGVTDIYNQSLDTTIIKFTVA